MSDPVNLNEMRADRAGDNALWSPVECVEAWLRDAKAGKINPRRVLVLYEEPEEDGGHSVAVYAANVQRDTEIALLHMRLHAATHKWQKNP